MEIINFFISHAETILNGAAQLVAGASILANLTRTDKDNRYLSKAGALINFLALNFKVKPVSSENLNQ